MTDLEIIAQCLPQINPAALEYDEWLAVGMAVKQAGGSVEMWDSWSQRDSGRYHQNECRKKWDGFRGSTNPVGVGSIVKLCRDQGGDVSFGNDSAAGQGRALDWDFVLPDDDLKIVRQEWLQESQIPPVPENWSGLADFQTYISTLFSADEFVGIVADAYSADGRWMPKKGEFNRSAGELLEEVAKAPDLGAIIGDWPEECGAWIRFNPLDGKGVADSNVTAYRYALVESDEISIERQFTIYHELELPIAAMVHSGGKSLHAIVKIDAPDFREYQKRVDFLYEVCKKNGLVIDRKNRNPSRLSRLPGATRNGVPQRLIETNTGKASWAEWADWIAAINDDLPEVESLSEFIDNPPPLSDCLIEGVLRKGHKMLVSGPSKAGKSFLLLELCVAIAEGREWLGWQCAQGRVLYVNLELDRASCYHRVKDVYRAIGIPPRNAGNLDMWHLRGKAMGMDNLAPRLIRRAVKRKYSAVVIDPIYKVITGDENAADQMAKFCNQFDRVASELGCAVIYCHHHSKGDQGQKRAQDRASGSGVFARDPDALIDMIELEIDDKRREQILNRWSCDAISRTMDQRSPGWRERISQDDALVAEKLAPLAVETLGQSEALRISSESETRAEQATGWRIGGILREFPAFKPRNVFFCYPVHPVDHWDLLADARADGEMPQRKSQKEVNAENLEIKNAETRMIVEELFEKNDIVEIGDVAKELGLTKKSIYNRLHDAGIEHKRGFVMNPNGKSRK